MSTGDQTTGKGAFDTAACGPALDVFATRSRQIFTVGVGLGVIAFKKAREHRDLVGRRLVDYVDR